MMKGYPRGFSSFSKPSAPHKPPKTHCRFETVYSGQYLDKATIMSLVKDWSGDEYSWEFFVYDDYGDSVINVEVTRKVEFDNETYETELAEYKMQYAEYRAKLAEWKPLKARYDAEQKTKRDEKDRKELERLKKRLGEA